MYYFGKAHASQHAADLCPHQPHSCCLKVGTDAIHAHFRVTRDHCVSGYIGGTSTRELVFRNHTAVLCVTRGMCEHGKPTASRLPISRFSSHIRTRFTHITMATNVSVKEPIRWQDSFVLLPNNTYNCSGVVLVDIERYNCDYAKYCDCPELQANTDIAGPGVCLVAFNSPSGWKLKSCRSLPHSSLLQR